jgi:hypothetical protein
MSPLHLRKWTPSTILTYVGMSAVILLLCSYVIFQARLLITGPQVTLDFVPETIQTVRTITLAGNTKNITEITLNGRDIMTTQGGHFNEDVVLQNGYTIVRINASDRYGRETTLEHEFVYTPLSLLPN